MESSFQLQDILDIIHNSENIVELNQILKKKTRIINFFNTKEDITEFISYVTRTGIQEPSKDLGDFQTPSHLTDFICSLLSSKLNYQPNIIVEPTCGKGSFILSALLYFPTVEYIYAIDIQKKYEWSLKLNILMFSFHHHIHADIEFHLDNVFSHIYSKAFLHFISEKTSNILVLGNPPWITTAQLSILRSKNLPFKSNLKVYKGIDAITGKGNFDIAESILIQLFKQFQSYKTTVAILCKTSVIRNLIRDVDILQLNIKNNRCFIINSKREFGINVDAALFLSDLTQEREKYCHAYSIYTIDQPISSFGYVNNKFVSHIELYTSISYLEGTSAFQWRHGIKNDAQKIYMLTMLNDGQLINGFHEYIDIEPDLLYPFIKSSQIKKPIITDTAYKIIITQHNLHENPFNIVSKNPRTFAYLTKYRHILDRRKSIIYKNRPPFSIFGIGEYCFYPYKIAISGMYKKPICTLIEQISNKPVMLDDTCYYLSFNNFKTALISWVLLNTDDFKKFLSSIVFLESKRPYTKEILMRVNMLSLAKSKNYKDIKFFYENNLLQNNDYDFTEEEYHEYIGNLEELMRT